MPAYKDENTHTWYVKFYYKDWTGKSKPKMKRGFARKKDALDYEASYKNLKAGKVDIPFKDFYELYIKYSENRHRPSTVANKRSLFEKHILPYLGERIMCEITAPDIVEWQNTKIEEEYLPTYLRSMHAKLSAIFNYAVNMYDLPSNPCKKAGPMGSKKPQTIDFWTLDEYRAFLPHVQNKPRAYTGFLILYWGGLRIGEMLALCPPDLIKQNGDYALNINKTWQTIKGEEHVGPPKTSGSVRVTPIPRFVGEQIENYMGMLYKCPDDERIFEGVTSYFFSHEIDRGAAAAGVKRIRVHDLRHSHVSLLIRLGYDFMMIAKRIGHTDIKYVTETYGHLYPEVHTELVGRLEQLDATNASVESMILPPKVHVVIGNQQAKEISS